MRATLPHQALVLDFSGWPVVECFVEALVVEPGDVLDDGELELGACRSDAVGDELGLEGVNEALGERVVIGVTDGADRAEHALIVEDLGVVDRGVLAGLKGSSQFASCAFSQKIREAGLAPSMGSAGAPFDNAMVEAFWARMQVELLKRKRWKTRVELDIAIPDYIEIRHNAQRRHSSLQMRTPTGFEDQHTTTTIAG